MRHFRDYAIGIIAAAGFISAVLSLVTTRWNDVSRAVRVRRSLLISGLLIIALVAAIVSTPAPPIVTTTIATGADSVVTESVLLTHETTNTTIEGSSTVTSDKTQRTATDVIKDTKQPRVLPPVIRDTTGRSVPQLVAVANRAVDTTRHRVTGTLSSRAIVEGHQAVRGSITVILTLDVEVTTGGTVTSAFTIESKGGGFNEPSAFAQARDRLTIALGEKLHQEVPR